MIQVGSTLPEMTFSLLEDGEMTNPHTQKLFGGKRVAFFAVPGAFTPTCSNSHLPCFIELADKIKAKGIDSIICMSVNDAFVMEAWGKQVDANDIVMLGDGDGSFTKAVGMNMDTGTFGGTRSLRYSMVVNDGEVEMVQIDDPGRFEVSDAKTLLAFLEESPSEDSE
jgi:peroxiredoxin